MQQLLLKLWYVSLWKFTCHCAYIYIYQGIASTLIIVRVGLGVDALPNSQNSRTTFSSAEDEDSINPEELNPMAYVNNGEIEHFQLKYTLDELQVDHNCLVDPMDGSKIRLEYHPIDQSHNPQSIGC